MTYQELIKATCEDIVNAVRNQKLPQVYNVLWQKNTLPNTEERIHWLYYCNIYSFLSEKYTNGKISIKLFYKDYEHEVYRGEKSFDGKQYVKTCLGSIWEYLNKDNLHLYISDSFFGIKKIYEWYKWRIKEELHNSNIYISHLKYESHINDEKNYINIYISILLND